MSETKRMVIAQMNMDTLRDILGLPEDVEVVDVQSPVDFDRIVFIKLRGIGNVTARGCQIETISPSVVRQSFYKINWSNAMEG